MVKVTTGSLRAAGLMRQVIFRFSSKHGARRWFFEVWVELYARRPFVVVFTRTGRGVVTTLGIFPPQFKRARRNV